MDHLGRNSHGRNSDTRPLDVFEHCSNKASWEITVPLSAGHTTSAYRPCNIGATGMYVSTLVSPVSKVDTLSIAHSLSTHRCVRLWTYG